jgi:hypothetical protein
MDTDDILPPRKAPPAEDTVPTTVRLALSLVRDIDKIAEASGYRRGEVIRRFLRRQADLYLEKMAKRPRR